MNKSNHASKKPTSFPKGNPKRSKENYLLEDHLTDNESSASECERSQRKKPCRFGGKNRKKARDYKMKRLHVQSKPEPIPTKIDCFGCVKHLHHVHCSGCSDIHYENGFCPKTGRPLACWRCNSWSEDCGELYYSADEDHYEYLFSCENCFKALTMEYYLPGGLVESDSLFSQLSLQSLVDDDAEFQRRMYNKKMYYTGYKGLLYYFGYFTQSQVGEMEFVGKLSEDITWTISLISRAKSYGQVFDYLLNFMKLRSNKRVFTIDNIVKATHKVFNFFKSLFGSLLPQSSESPFGFLKKIVDKYDEVKNSTLFKKMYKFIMYLLCNTLIGSKDFCENLFKKLYIDVSERKKFHMGPDFLRTIVDTIHYVCETGYQCFKRGSFDHIFHSGDKYREWIDNAHDLRRKSNFLTNPEPHGFSRYEFLGLLAKAIEEGDSICKHATLAGREEATIVKHMLSELKFIRGTELTKKAAAEPRRAPFALLLYGGSSVGKSILTDSLMEYYGKLHKLPTDPEYIYTRNPVDPHWNLFNTQCWGLKLDDIAFLDPKVVQGGDPSLLEMLMIINNVPFVPPQADLADKGRTPLISRFVVATTNTEHLNTVSQFSCPLAIQRRLPWIVDVKPKPEYAKDVSFLDPHKLPPPSEGEYPDYWIITLKRVVPANESREHQMAKIVEVQTFTSIYPFLAWMGKESLAFLKSQDTALSVLDFVKSTDICEHCCFPESHCICDEFPEPEEDIQILPSPDIIICDCCGCNEDECKVWCNRCFNMKGECRCLLPQSETVYQDLEVREDLVNEYVQRISPRPLPELDPHSVERYWIYLNVWLYWHLSDAYLIFYLLILNFLSYLCSTTWPLLIIPIILFFSRFFVNRVYGQGRMLLWISKHALRYICVRLKAKLLVHELGEKVRIIFDDPRMAIVRKVLPAVLVSLASVAVVRHLFSFSLEKQSVEELDLEDIGETPVGNDETKNPWYKDEFVLTKFDVSEKTTSYNGLTPEKLDEILLTNCVNFVMKFAGKKVETKAIGLGGHIYLTNAHSFPEGNFTLGVVNCLQRDGVTSNVQTLVTPSQVRIIKDRDVALVRLTCLPPKKNIIDLFCNESLKGRHKGYYLGRNADGTVFRRSVPDIRYEPLANNALLRNIPNWAGYAREPTQTGDCGSILISLSHRGPIILGIHFLGGGKEIAAAKITREFLLEEVRGFEPMLVQSGNPVLSAPGHPKELGALSKKSVFRYIEQGTLNVYGSFTGFRSSHKSSVKPTLMKEEMEKLGYTCKFGAPNMSGWEPWRKSVLDNLEPTTTMNQDILHKCVEQFSKEIIEGLGPKDKEELKVYDVFTSVNGAAGVKFVDKMNRNTSMGFPWKKSKKYFMRPIAPVGELLDPVEMDSTVLDRVKDIIYKYRNGERACPVFCGNLKDEVVSERKVRDKKVRVFYGAPCDWSIVVRMYLLSFVRVLQKNTFVFEAAPGCNVHSKQWDEFYHYLTTFGEDRVVAGDFKGFDKRMGATLILAAFDIILNILRDAGYSDSDLLVVKGIAEDTAFALTDFNGDLVEFFGTNPSGHPLTVIINSLVNSLYMRYCYMLLNPGRECESFKRRVHLLTYGDDNIMNIHGDCPWFTHSSISRVLSTIGITYTMADKDAASVPYIDIKDATFLKRRWRFDKDVGLFVAPLEEESIIRSLMLCVESKSVPMELQCVDIMDSACREWFYYGRETFEDKRKMLQNLIEKCDLSIYKHPGELPTYEAILEGFWETSLSPQMKIEEIKSCTVCSGQWAQPCECHREHCLLEQIYICPYCRRHTMKSFPCCLPMCQDCGARNCTFYVDRSYQPVDDNEKHFKDNPTFCEKCFIWVLRALSVPEKEMERHLEYGYSSYVRDDSRRSNVFREVLRREIRGRTHN